MKKLVSVLLVLALLVATGICYAESNLEIYQIELAGTSWLIRSSTGSKGNDKIITIPEKAELKGGLTGYADVPLLTEDAEGNVYLTCIGMNYVISGILTFTMDEDIMVLYTGNGPNAILQKQ